MDALPDMSGESAKYGTPAILKIAVCEWRNNLRDFITFCYYAYHIYGICSHYDCLCACACVCGLSAVIHISDDIHGILHCL